jgi:uncharacterized protein with HEPN domain
VVHLPEWFPLNLQFHFQLEQFECYPFQEQTELEHRVEYLNAFLLQLAGYRNRLVHMYNIISDEELYQVIQSNTKDIENFVSKIKKYLDTLKNEN